MINWSKYRYIDINKWLHPGKRKISIFLVDIAMLVAVFSSMRASFTWSIEGLCPPIAATLCVAAMVLSNSMATTIFSRRDFFFAIISCLFILLYEKLSTNSQMVDYIQCLFNAIIFLTLLRLDITYLKHLGKVLCKVLAILIGISFLAYCMYLVGFNLPHHASTYGLYYYTNYYFFLLDDRSLFVLIPRFHAFFLEPGHMGTLIVLLLASQKGEWRHWYNVILIIASLASFSLAAYCLLVVVIILHLWIDRKNIARKLLTAAVIIAAIVYSAMQYNEGDNMLNQMIVMRLAINETGDDIEGNNRVKGWFQDEFDSYLHTSDIIFGRDMPKNVFGNAGYKVYLYEHGLVGMLLMYMFYILSMNKGPDKRAFIAMLALSTINLLIRAYPLWFGFYIPYYLMAYQQTDYHTLKKVKENLISIKQFG